MLESPRNKAETVNSRAEKELGDVFTLTQFGGYLPAVVKACIFNNLKKRYLTPYAAIREPLDNSLAVGDFPGFNASEAFFRYDEELGTLEFLDNGLGMTAKRHAEALNINTESDAIGAILSQYGVGMKDFLAFFSGHATTISKHKTAGGAVERSVVAFGEDYVEKIAACLCLVIPEGFMTWIEKEKIQNATWGTFDDYHRRVAPTTILEATEDHDQAQKYVDDWETQAKHLKRLCKDSYHSKAAAPANTPFENFQDILDCFKILEGEDKVGTGTLLRMWLRPEMKAQHNEDGSVTPGMFRVVNGNLEMQEQTTEPPTWVDCVAYFESNYPYMHSDAEQYLRPEIWDPVHETFISYDDYDKKFREHGGFKFSIQGKPVSSEFNYCLYPAFFPGRESETPLASLIQDANGTVLARVIKSMAVETLEDGRITAKSAVLMGGSNPDATHVKSHRSFNRTKEPMCTLSFYKGNRLLGKPRLPPKEWNELWNKIGELYNRDGRLYAKGDQLEAKRAQNIKDLKTLFSELCGVNEVEKQEIFNSLSTMEDNTFEGRLGDLVAMANCFRTDIYLVDATLIKGVNDTKDTFKRIDELTKRVYKKNFMEEWQRVNAELDAERERATAAAAARAAAEQADREAAAQHAAEKRAEAAVAAAEKKRLAEERQTEAAAKARAEQNLPGSSDNSTEQEDAAAANNKYVDEAETLAARKSGSKGNRSKKNSKSASYVRQKRKPSTVSEPKPAKRTPASTSDVAGPSSTPAVPRRGEATAPHTRPRPLKVQKKTISFGNYSAKIQNEFKQLVQNLKREYNIPEDCALVEALSSKVTNLLDIFRNNLEMSGIVDPNVTFPDI